MFAITPQSSMSLASNHSQATADVVSIGQKRLRTISEPPLAGPHGARPRERAFRYDTIHDDVRDTEDTRSLTSKMEKQLSWRNSPKFRTIIAGKPIRSVSGNIADSIEGHSSMRHSSDHRLHAQRHIEASEFGCDNKACRYEADAHPIAPKPEFPENAALKKMVDDIFKEFESVDVEGIRALKDVVYENLVCMKISTDEFNSILNDLQSADCRTALIMGMLSALGFIAGGRGGELLMPVLKSMMSAPALALMPGGMIGVVDRLTSSLLADIHPGYYTAPDPDLLGSVMQKCLTHYQRPLLKELVSQAGALSAPYTIRNVFCSLSAAVASPGLIQLFSDLGGLPAGAFVQYLRNSNNKDENLMHPAYFFGRADWKQHMRELRSPVHHKLMRLINRACKGSANIPNMAGNAISRLFALDSATEITLLAVFFAGIEHLKTMVEQKFEGASDPSQKYVTHATGTASLLGLYVFLSVAMTCSGWATQRLSRLQPCPAPAAVTPSDLNSSKNRQRH